MSFELARFLTFCGTEFKGFFDHLGAAAQEFASTGQLPSPRFDASVPSHQTDGVTDKEPNGKQSKARAEKQKRKPTAFNMFIRQTVEDLKSQGIKPKEGEGEGGVKESYLTLAVEKWKTMTGEQKKEYIEKHKPEFEGVELQHEPSSRQFYLRHKVAELKRQGTAQGGATESYQSLAVQKWNALTVDERRNEIERYKHHDSGELEEEPNGPAVVEAKSPQQPEALAVLGSPVSSKKEKKDKKKEKKRKSEAGRRGLHKRSTQLVFGPDASEPAIGSPVASGDDVKKKKKKKKKSRDGGP